MSRIKIYKHLMYTDFFNIRTKIKNFQKPRVTKDSRDKIVRG